MAHEANVKSGFLLYFCFTLPPALILSKTRPMEMQNFQIAVKLRELHHSKGVAVIMFGSTEGLSPPPCEA